MATLSKTRHKGGPLANYSQSFGGLRDFYKQQKPGATQHEQLQNLAVTQQDEAGGFYRPGSEPKPMVIPRVAPPMPAPGPKNLPLRDMGGGNMFITDAGQALVDTMDQQFDAGGITMEQRDAATKLLQANTPVEDVRAKLSQAFQANQPPAAAPLPPALTFQGTFARPAGMGEDTPTLASGAVPAGGRSMNDPSRIVESLARRNRGDARAQLGAAEFIRGDADRAEDREAAGAKQALDIEKFNITQGGINRRAANSIMATDARTAAQRDAADKRAAERLKFDKEKLAQSLVRPPLDVQDIPGTNHVIPWAGAKPMGTLPRSTPAPFGGMVETAPSSGVFVNPKVSGGERFEMTAPGIPALTTPGRLPVPGFGSLPIPQFSQPAQDPKFKPLEKSPGKPLTPIDIVNDVAKLDAIIRGTDGIPNDPETVRMAKALKAKYKQDFDKNGIPDVLEDGGGTVEKPTSAFQKAVQ